jgi:hypothetical protein
LRLLSLAERHKLSEGEHTLQVFKVDFTDLQHRLLTLLGVSELAFQLESQPVNSRYFASSTCGM